MIKKWEYNFRSANVCFPMFMPVATYGSLKPLAIDKVIRLQYSTILCNTYHLYLQPGAEVVKEIGGVHALTGFAGNILTDSGGFQIFSLGKLNRVSEEGVYFINPKNGDRHFITPEKSIQIQFTLGSDIIMAFDHLVGLKEIDSDTIKSAGERSVAWLDRCVLEFEKQVKLHLEADPAFKRPSFFGIVQGGLNKELREYFYQETAKRAIDGIAIGGLSVGETREQMHDMLKFLANIYKPNLPHYLMGVGHPVDLLFAYHHGIDMADCVLPTRNARHGQLWNCNPNINLEELKNPDFANLEKYFIFENLKASKYQLDINPLSESCLCSACQSGISKASIHQMLRTANPLAGSLIAEHNLMVLQTLVKNL